MEDAIYIKPMNPLDDLGEGQRWQAEYIELLKKMAGVDLPKKD